MYDANCRMAQVIQWPPAIRNYMRRAGLKYQHVIADFPLLTASLNTIEYMHACRKPQKTRLPPP